MARRRGHKHKHGRRHHSKRYGGPSVGWGALLDFMEPDKPKKPRAPRKKKEPPLGTIKEVAVRPARRIRIVEGE